jgi:hypothetical protein
MNFLFLLFICFPFIKLQKDCSNGIDCISKADLNISKAITNEIHHREKLLTMLEDNKYIARKPWFTIGSLSEFFYLIKQYPLNVYEWGVAYNSNEPIPVIISNWNVGIRITGSIFYPQGDDIRAMTRGTVMFSYATKDEETVNCRNKEGLPGWVQSYVNQNLEKYGGNGCIDQYFNLFYARKK